MEKIQKNKIVTCEDLKFGFLHLLFATVSLFILAEAKLCYWNC